MQIRTKYQHKAEFCKILSRIGLIKFVITKTKTRDTAPYFVRLDLLMSFPKEFQRSIDTLLKIANFEIGIGKFSRIAGATTKALPYVAVLAHTLGKPILFIKTGKTLGRERRVDGILNPGDKVLIVDDMISTGKTAEIATEKLRSEGASVEDLVVLLDNQRGGKERLKGKGVNLHAFITISEVANHFEEMSVITSDQRKIIHESVKKKGSMK